MTHRGAVPVLAIDGPSGAGKGTVAMQVALRTGWNLLDSGALYRAVGYAAHAAGDDLHDEAGIVARALRTRIGFRLDTDAAVVHTIIDGTDVGDQLRTESCAAAASTVASYPGVRAALLDKQRALRQPPGLVADGRDMGTVVFPDATYKVFLTASAEERALRRYKQLKDKGLDVKLAALIEDIQARDARDASRAVAPLKPAVDAVLVDTTHMSVDEVVGKVLGLLSPASGRPDPV